MSSKAKIQIPVVCVRNQALYHPSSLRGPVVITNLSPEEVTELPSPEVEKGAIVLTAMNTKTLSTLTVLPKHNGSPSQEIGGANNNIYLRYYMDGHYF